MTITSEDNKAIRVRTRHAVLSVLLFLTLAPQSARSQTVSKGTASNPERAYSAEQIFQRVAPRLAVLRSIESGETHSLASAIVLSSDGFLGTNYHAIQGADEVEVTIPIGQTGQHLVLKHLKLMYLDNSEDLAILKADVDGLPYLSCPNDLTMSVTVGERVYALGNPRGMESTISDGIISGLRTLDGQDAIQHTAPISPGSSGGALVDSQGILVGVNSWQIRDSQNLNFAIPRKYLCQALTQAQQATTALAFPKDDSQNEDDWGRLARKALAQGDYIQAINQGTQAVAAGHSSAEIYSILGAAYYQTGDREQAELYARQCLALAGPDDEFKQTARLYLLKVFRDKFNADSISVDRGAYLKLATEFLSSSPIPIVATALYEQTKQQAASIAGILKSIAGTWTGASDAEDLAGTWKDNLYEIQSDNRGGFRLSTKNPNHGSFTLAVSGTITGTPDNLMGTLERDGESISGGFAGVGRQPITIMLRLSDDMMSLEGTASYGSVRASGELSDVVLTLMGTRIGERRIKLVRSENSGSEWKDLNRPADAPTLLHPPASR